MPFYSISFVTLIKLFGTALFVVPNLIYYGPCILNGVSYFYDYNIKNAEQSLADKVSETMRNNLEAALSKIPLTKKEIMAKASSMFEKYKERPYYSTISFHVNETKTKVETYRHRYSWDKTDVHHLIENIQNVDSHVPFTGMEFDFGSTGHFKTFFVYYQKQGDNVTLFIYQYIATFQFPVTLKTIPAGFLAKFIPFLPQERTEFLPRNLTDEERSFIYFYFKVRAMQMVAYESSSSFAETSLAVQKYNSEL